jgi:hypothetical protein
MTNVMDWEQGNTVIVPNTHSRGGMRSGGIGNYEISI